MMSTADLVIHYAEKFYQNLLEDENSQDRYWEHCYKIFHNARQEPEPNYDYLSLHLAFYLASWGMYRGSSFLTRKDYRIHFPVVQELLKSRYDCLFGLECKELRKPEIQQELSRLESFIESYYKGIRSSCKGPVNCRISATLITKILIGTLGCVPVYDRYFTEGIRCQKTASGTYCINSLLCLADFYEENYGKLEKTRKNFKVYDLYYPQMKVLDMGFSESDLLGNETNNTQKKLRYEREI